MDETWNDTLFGLIGLAVLLVIIFARLVLNKRGY